MQPAIAVELPKGASLRTGVISRVRAEAPTVIEWAAALTTAFLLILAFPNFEWPFLAWIALVPLFVVIARRPSILRGFILGWATASLFFYASCYWLTYSVIHYGGLPTWLAYTLLAPAAATAGLFSALAVAVLLIVWRKHGSYALMFTPFVWVACEWLRLGVTGQLWNAIGYSQAYHPSLIQTASWGGVYAVGFMIVAVNAAIALVIVQRGWRSIALSAAVLVCVAVALALSTWLNLRKPTQSSTGYLNIVAVQPNVSMTPGKSDTETQELIDRHLKISIDGLQALRGDSRARLVVWPESPMNFTYSSDKPLQSVVSAFVKENHTSLLLNSLEPAPNDGGYNSALLINEEGRVISQYDKIRLLPFGEYVPLPSWLGGSLISGIVGDFTAGDKYTLMPVADHRVGVFICIESAYPSIARNLTREGADVLINISNDGYLGPTAVMRQHLANAVFRAVENGRPLLRVTNSGISAKISPDGYVSDVTSGFVVDGRVWSVSDRDNRTTFYAKHGDMFVQFCGIVTLIILVASFFQVRRSLRTT